MKHTFESTQRINTITIYYLKQHKYVYNLLSGVTLSLRGHPEMLLANIVIFFDYNLIYICE